MEFVRFFLQRRLLILLAIVIVTLFVNYSYVPPKKQLFSTSNQRDIGNWKNHFTKFVNYIWKTPKLWPDEDAGDRIVEQMAFDPPNLDEMTQGGTKLKTILLRNASRLWVTPTFSEQQSFLEDNCLVKMCRITTNESEFKNADVVIFNEISVLPKEGRPHEDQIWVLYMLESPLNTPHFTQKRVFNWTATYRPDSDVPNPYGKFYLHDPAIISRPQTINYAANKTKKAAWFASNCHASNKRLEYAIELSKYIDVDHFGRCIKNNTHSCPRSKKDECYQMLKNDYKFYLSFENSNCHHYITEKFFYNALGNDVIPIVMGARKEDYEKAAPYGSFIHVDDFESPKALAEYLHVLDKNDTLYNEYFQWKGTGEFSLYLNAHFWCRFCAMLHSEIPKKTYDDLEKWWRSPGICTSGSWKALVNQSDPTTLK